MSLLETNSAETITQAMVARYRCPEYFLDWDLGSPLSQERGYFRFGPNVIGYGRTSMGRRQSGPAAALDDLYRAVEIRTEKLILPFDPTEIIENLRLERYTEGAASRLRAVLKKVYYAFRPMMNVAFRSRIQQFRARNWDKAAFPKWPVDTTVDDLSDSLLLLSMEAQGVERIPFVWFWPKGATACFTMTHDVETEAGRAFCGELMDLNDSVGIKSSFQLIPETRYQVSPAFLESIRCRGFEVAVHDLYHDGLLYDDREEFLRRAAKINQYLADWGATGFRAGALYRKPEWFDSFNFSYDMSIPNVGHLDPQPGGCCTVLPYFIGDVLEIPVTAVQDYMLFHIIKSRSLDIWETQIQTILKKNGMASFIIHPDYILDAENRSVYSGLLKHLRETAERHDAWIALPSEIDQWWRARSQMSVAKHGGAWRIEGDGAEDAVLAYAIRLDGRLVFELDRKAS